MVEIKDPKTGRVFQVPQERVTKGPVRHAVGRGKVAQKRLEFYLKKHGLGNYREDRENFFWDDARVYLRVKGRATPQKGWTRYIASKAKLRPENIERFVLGIKRKIEKERAFWTKKERG